MFVMMYSAKMAPANIRLNPVGALVCVAVAFCIVIYIFGFPDWFRSEPRISMKELLSVSIELAKRGGTKVHEIKQQNSLENKVKGKTEEGADELLTKGDIESHRAIVYGFAKAFPGLKVNSEEHDLKPIDLSTIPEVNKHNPEVEEAIVSDQSIAFKDITVWIDPLDATQEYTEDLNQYVTTMVCVAINGDATIGVIHKPFVTTAEQTSWAWVGYGMSKNLQSLKDVKKTADKTESEKVHKIIVSRSHSGTVKRVAETAFGKNVEVILAGGAGYKTLEVIKGKADAYTHVTNIKKWDICAGNALLSAMDGKMTTLEGNYITYYPNGNVINDHGLLATISDHFNLYLKKLAPAAEEIKKETEQQKEKQKRSTQKQTSKAS